MKKTIGIFAHVDAGKTTFSEQLLYKTNTLRKIGRVDNKDSFLDSHFLEKERGITIYSDIGIFNYNGNEYYLVDTPGHIDFSAEMERTFCVLDYAILLISAVEGIQAHTETLWDLLRENKIPTFIFINKTDREGADVDGILGELRKNFSSDILYLPSLDFKDEDLEFISERDEFLLEDYLEGNIEKDNVTNTLKSLINKREIFVTMSGSALLSRGIDEFLEVFDKLTITSYNESGEILGKVHKIRYDKDGNRITFIKLMSGTLKVKDILTYEYNGDVFSEKINSIRLYNGEKYTALDKFKAGDICGVIGLSNLKPYMDLKGRKITKISMIPTLSSKVIYDNKLNPKDVLGYFKMLEEEEGTLNVLWNEEFSEIVISIMGEIQLQVIKELCLERFNLSVDFDKPQILYKETISGQTIGYGHFEPLKHYAEVHLMIEGAERGSGIKFENKCHTDNLSTGHMNLIKTHIFEREHKGILTGSPLTDLKITLLNGRSHNKHTSGGDFREATKRALRHGLEFANNILLEPYYKFVIQGESALMGRFLSDIQKMKGNFEEPEIRGDKVIIKGIGPVSNFRGYPLEIQGFTKGKGRISLVFSGYYPCHNSNEVINNINYNRNADKEYTSSSIFCSKGQGFIVEAKDVKEFMHCDIE